MKHASLYGIISCLIALHCALVVNAQQAVPVRDEPRHKPVLQNKYVRVLDVWLPPGDTTLYHIHSTPSLFNFFTGGKLSTQIKNGPWELSEPQAGFTWYKSFENDTLIHRIINVDTVACHVMDVELIDKYDTDGMKPESGHLPFELLYENERASAYRVAGAHLINYKFEGRGPIIVELVDGNGIVYHNSTQQQTKELKAGMYLYIDPNSSFYFTNKQDERVHMVLFELK
jgi:hypothetical protein